MRPPGVWLWLFFSLFLSFFVLICLWLPRLLIFFYIILSDVMVTFLNSPRCIFFFLSKMILAYSSLLFLTFWGNRLENSQASLDRYLLVWPICTRPSNSSFLLTFGSCHSPPSRVVVGRLACLGAPKCTTHDTSSFPTMVVGTRHCHGTHARPICVFFFFFFFPGVCVLDLQRACVWNSKSLELPDAFRLLILAWG